jgi:hypothetical protein
MSLIWNWTSILDAVISYLVLLLKFEHDFRALRSFEVLLKFIIVVVKVNKAWSSALEKQQWKIRAQNICLTFPVGFWIPIISSNLYLNFSNVLDLRNLQEQVKKDSGSKIVLTFRFSASNFKSFSWALEHFFFSQ